jgi:aminotransferase
MTQGAKRKQRAQRKSEAPSRSVFDRIEPEGDTSDIARRVAQISVSAIKQMPVLASKVAGCVSLGQGIPSFNTPEFIRRAVVEELQNPNTVIGKYSIQPGLPDLKREIARDLKRTRNVVHIDPDKEIFVSCGGMEALAAGIATIVERGDEVILPSPTYASHIEQVLFAEGVPKFVPLVEDSGWKLDTAAIRKAVSKNTKAIVLCNPVNPTGTVFSETELNEIADIVLEHDLFLILDEAYDFLVYDGLPYFSLISLSDLQENVIAVCSFSKRYCMTGWRVGFMYASERIIRQVLKVHDAFAICAPTISQYAALAALRATNGVDGEGDRSVRELVDALARRRDLVCNRLDRLPEIFDYSEPLGGYYVFPTLVEEESSIDFALRVLNEARVIVIPGAAFGPTGENHVRMSFGADEAELSEAFDRLDKYFS